LGKGNKVHASKSRRDAVAGVDTRFHAGAISPQVQPQFAPSPEFESGGTIAKRPAAGPTSRLLRVFLHHRLDGWRHRMMDECPDVPGPGDGLGPVLDEGELQELCANLSAAEAREFVWLCIVDTELRLTDIVTRRAAGDLDSVAEIANGIAREAARLGAVRVHVLALRLETACRSGSAGTCSLISELSDAWTQVGDTMCAWLTRQASPAVAA
jgi:hypothetical protein